MKHVTPFEEFESNEGFKLFPSHNDIVKNKLQFLKNINLDEENYYVNKPQEIKDLMTKVDLVMKSKNNTLKPVIDKAEAPQVLNMLNILKNIKSDLLNDTDIGWITYIDSVKKFVYNPAFNLP